MDSRKDGLSLVIVGLIDAAEKASYSVALGTGALGASIWGLGLLGASGTPLTLMSISAFFLFAKLGRRLDAVEQQNQNQFAKSNGARFLKEQLMPRQKQIRESSQEYESKKQVFYLWQASFTLEDFLALWELPCKPPVYSVVLR